MASVGFGGYTFEIPQDVNLRFGRAEPNLTEQAGVDGAFLHDVARPRVLTGNLRVDFALYSLTRAGMQELRDGIAALENLPLSILTHTPTGGAERFCYAIVRNVDIPEDQAGNSDLIQSGSISWAVPDPRWRRHAQSAALWRLDGSRTIGETGLRIGTGVADEAVQEASLASGTGELTLTLNNAGNADTPLDFVLQNDGSSALAGLVVTRQGARTHDRVKPGQSIPADGQLHVSGERDTLDLDGQSLLASATARYRPGLLGLEPGDNVLTVARPASGPALTVWLRWEHSWR